MIQFLHQWPGQIFWKNLTIFSLYLTPLLLKMICRYQYSLLLFCFQWSMNYLHLHYNNFLSLIIKSHLNHQQAFNKERAEELKRGSTEHSTEREREQKNEGESQIKYSTKESRREPNKAIWFLGFKRTSASNYEAKFLEDETFLTFVCISQSIASNIKY